MTGKSESPANLSASKTYVWTTELADLAQSFSDEFAIPLAEVREWYQYASDKAGLVGYMRRALDLEREWRAKVRADMRARQAVPA